MPGALPGRVDVHLEVHDEVAGELFGPLDRASSDGYDLAAAAARLGEVSRLELAESRFATLVEDLVDRAFRPLDLGVDVHELTSQPARNLRSGGRLAGSHEADEHEVEI